MRYSIILPVRNGGEYVKECVYSILSQTLNDFQLQVLDNNSSDGTRQWIESLNDNRIYVYPSDTSLTIEENWGRIIQIPKNEFITLIGHDDILEPYYLEEMNRLIAKHPSASLYQTHYKYIDKDGNTTRHCLPMTEVQSAYEFLAFQMNSIIDSTGTGYMMRSKDFDDLGGMPRNYPNLIFSDYELWIKLGSKSYKATSLKECFRYREHLSVSRGTNGMLYQEAFEEYMKLIIQLQKDDEKFNEVIDRYGKKMLLYFCESLSHRLLKTPIKQRSITVEDLVNKFRGYADQIIPNQLFEPIRIPRIRYAVKLDKSWLTRQAFNLYRMLLKS